MGKCNVLSRKGKRFSVSPEDQVYIGLDVHKRMVNIAVRVNGTLVYNRMCPSAPKVILGLLRPLRCAARKVVYEAGPTGFGLYRALRAEGFPAHVVAPGKTPRPANPGNKTDRLDCSMLAEYAEKDLLQPVEVPTQEQEADRQIIRTRDQLMRKLRRVKQQIKSFLLQHGVDEPEGLANWSKEGIQGLRQLALLPQLRLCLDVLLAELSKVGELLKQVEAKLRELAQSERHAQKHKLLRTHPGVGLLTAMNFLVELYQPERFEVPRQVALFVGLLPRVSQSGETRRDGPIIKAGRPWLRAMLVEAAWQWVRVDPRAQSLYRRLVANTGSGRKAIVAVARQICVDLWCMLIHGEPYRPDG